MRKLKSESGYTLIESIAFLGVMAMLAVAVIMTINKMHDRYKLSRVGNQIVDLQKSIDYRFSAAENFSAIDIPMLRKENLIPGDMLTETGVFHSYAGPVEIKPTRGGFAYTIEFKELPIAACMELAMIDWSMGHTSHLVNVRVNGKNHDWKGLTTELPITLDMAEKLCTNAGNNNNILWQFQ